MNQLFYIVSQTVYFFLEAIGWLIFGRVILGFFIDEESPVLVFCCTVTEPIVAPVRMLLSKIPVLGESPIDFSFMATYLLIILVQSALPLS